MLSVKHNLIMAKATGLIFSLFDVASARGAFRYTAVHAMRSSGSYQFVFHSSLLTEKTVDLVVACDGFLCVTKSSIFFMVATLIAEVLFKQFLIRTAV